MSLPGPCIALLLVAIASACGTTQITSSTKEAGAQPLERGQKVLAMVVSPDAKGRQTAEDELARLLQDGTAAHRVFNDEQLKDRAVLRERLSAEGYKYVVVMKFLRLEPGTHPAVQPVNDFYADQDPLLWSDQEQDYTSVFVSTRVYTVADGKMVWEAQSESVDPSGMKQLVDDIAEAADKRLKDEGMVVEK
jgi:hypothetical protein